MPWIWLSRRANRERAALYKTGAAVWEALFGNAAAGKRMALEALELSNGRDVEYGAAFALALAADSGRSQALANDLEKRFPEDTFVRFTYLPTLRGLLALSHGNSSSAIEQLEMALTYETAVPGIDLFAFFGGLYSAYVRGEAYLAAHRGTEAAAEFQKILDHRGIVAADPVGALARLQLGRAFRYIRRQGQGKSCLPGLPHALEKRRPGHSDPQASQVGILQAVVNTSCFLLNHRPARTRFIQ